MACNVELEIIDELTQVTLEVCDSSSGQAADISAKADKVVALSTGTIGNVATSINADPAKIDVSFDGAVFSDIANGTYKTVGSTNLTAVTVTGLASRDLSYFAVDSTGSIVFQGTDFTALQRRDFAKIGVVFHPNRTTISSVTLNPIGADDVGGLVNDYFESIPPLNISGNMIEPASTDRSIKRTAGKVFGLGANAANSIKSKHILTTPEASPATFVTNWRASGGTGVMFGSGTQIDFTKWDNASGTLQTTSGKKTTVKRVYLFPQSLTLSIMYGQRIYDDFDKAIAGYLSNSFEQRNDISSGIFLGWIIAQADTTNIAAAITANKARIIPASSASAGSTGAGFDPAAAQTITGQWTFDISGGKSFYATDDLTFAASTTNWGIFDHVAALSSTTTIVGAVATNSVTGHQGGVSVILHDDGEVDGSFYANNAGVRLTDRAADKKIALYHSGTDYLTIDHIAGTSVTTGNIIHNLSGSRSAYASNLDASMTWGIFDHDILISPTTVILGGNSKNTVAATTGELYVTLGDEGSSTGAIRANNASVEVRDTSTQKDVKLSHSGTDYITIDHLLGTIKLGSLPTYADEAAAVTAGLATDTVYKTATGELRIKL